MRFRNLALPFCALACASYFRAPFVSAQSAPATALEPRAITVDDAFEIREVRDPQISDDGKWVAYTVATPSLKEDKTETRIWMAPAGGGDAIVMTAEKASSSHPRWSPDGKFLAFLSKRNEGKTQVWLLNRLGGEAQQLTDAIQDVDDFAWSPDSKRLVLLLRDPSPEELAEAKTRDKDNDKPGSNDKDKDAKPKKPKTPPPFVIDRYRFKTDTIGYLDRRRAHLYVFDVATKAVTQVTSGDFDDEEPAWSPDGKLLAFSSNRSVPDPDRTYDSNIWVVAADNTDKGGHLTQVTTNPGADRAPAWSPDGKWIAYVTQLDPKLFDYATHHIAVSPAAGGQAKVLTLAFDRMSRLPRFSPDGQFIYFIADDDGSQNLCRIPAMGGDITRPISGRVVISSYSIAKSGELAAQITTMDRPGEIFTTATSGGLMTRVTHVNDAFMAKIKVVTPEYVKFKSKDGTTVAGYLYKPLDYVAGKKYPTLLIPHGGPVGAYYGEFYHFWQLLAANGYVVLEPNPRGSSGYGQHFCKAIFADWGNKDYQDDIAMVDYAIALGLADPDKLGVGGWSYGGISTDFIIAQTTRFKAAISGAGSAFFASLYGHDQYILDYDVELGHPWDNRAVWDKISPFYKVANITTPTLFMGGDIDWNVPVVGGEQMYEAMKSLGRETELVVYPGEYHGFKTPSHIKDRLERNLSWYAHYVKTDGTPGAASGESKLEAVLQSSLRSFQFQLQRHIAMQRVDAREILDSDACSPADVETTLRISAGVNRWFGGVATTQRMLERVARVTGMKHFSLLEVAAGSGEVPETVRKKLARRGIALDVVLLDRARSHLPGENHSVVGDALALPFGDGVFDLVSCNLFAHHLNAQQLAQFVRESLRVGQQALLINDLVRHPLHLALAYAGYPIMRSRVAWLDGLTSVRRAYVPEEIRSVLASAFSSEAMRVEISRNYLFRMGVIVWKS